MFISPTLFQVAVLVPWQLLLYSSASASRVNLEGMGKMVWYSVSHGVGNSVFCRWYDDVIKWKHFPRYRSPVNSPHKGQWHGALMSSLICARISGWVNSREAGDLRRHRVHYDVTVMRKHDKYKFSITGSGRVQLTRNNKYKMQPVDINEPGLTQWKSWYRVFQDLGRIRE